MNLVAVSLAAPDWSPDPNAFYEYIVGKNGLFIHAGDERLFAAIPIAPAHVNNALSRVEPTVSLLILSRNDTVAHLPMCVNRHVFSNLTPDELRNQQQT